MNDDDLRSLLDDAVTGVEPADRLDAIRARTSAPARRLRPAVVGAAALATAAAVVGGVVLGQRLAGPGTPDQPPVATPADVPVAVYYQGMTPQGPRLYRSYEQAGDDTLSTALGLLADQPSDPDYRSPWPAGALEAGAVVDGVIEVTLAADADVAGPGGPPDEAVLAVQQVVYTAQAAVQERLPVRFVRDGAPVEEVFGVDTSAPVSQAPPLETLALVSISDPAEGQVVDDGSFLARGVASSFEATVPWEIRDDAGAVVSSGFATADGFLDRLHPWSVEVDVSDLAPGRYTFVASTSDPSGGAEGAGPTTDTRTLVVR